MRRSRDEHRPESSASHAKERWYFTTGLTGAAAVRQLAARLATMRSLNVALAMDPFTVIVMLAIHLVGSGGLMFLVWRLMPNAPGLGRWWIASCLFGLTYLGRPPRHGGRCNDAVRGAVVR